MEVVASLSQGRTAAAQCGLFTHKSVPVIFEPPCTFILLMKLSQQHDSYPHSKRINFILKSESIFQRLQFC